MFKNEDEFFLEIQDTDQLFSSWANLVNNSNEEDVKEAKTSKKCNLQLQ